LTSQEAIDYIGQFMPKEWKFLKPEGVEVVRVQTGFVNQVYIISNNQTIKEPRKLVIRKYGGNMVQDTTLLPSLTTTQELILLCELGRRNMAAKMYGFFDGGRIEEFLDIHQMTEDDSVTTRIESDMAKNIARFHAVDNVPFPRPGYKFADTLAHVLSETKKSFEMLLKMDSHKEVHHIYSYDWETELNWISPLLDPSRHRIVLMHGDAHLQNIGVKNNCTIDEGELSTILYDYEMSSYNLRGKDLGLLLMSRVGILNPEFIEKNGIEFPSEDKCKNFIEEYMKECRELFDDWDETGKDSFNHIMMETIIGGMVACEEAFVEVMTPSFMPVGIKILNGFYFACKERLQTSYPNFAKDL